MLSDLLCRLRALFRRYPVEAELDEEPRFHLERQAEKYRQSGTSAGEAARRARLALGGPEHAPEEYRDARGTRCLEDCVQDFRYALRTLRKSPAFAVVAAVTVAVGIGASTAIFSVTDAVLLRPLPYRDPHRLVLTDSPFSNAGFLDLRNGTNTVFEDMSAVMVFRAVVPREDGSAERVSKAQVTTNFFRMMGAKIAFGRDFTEADGQPQAQPEPIFPPPQGAIAILGYEYWQRRYGGNTAVIGHEMLSSGRRGPRIVGVLAPGFKLFLPARVTLEPTPDVWIANNRGYDAAHRGDLMLQVIGRLKEGVTLERAQAEADVVASDWRKNGREFHVRLEPMHKPLVAEVRPAILALMGAVMFLLLIACANVANLLLVRASLRERELAMRAALGARFGRLMRQMLAEAVLLSGLGTLLGVGLAWAGIHQLLVAVPANLPRLESIAIDWRALAFAAITGLAEAAIFGVMPAWRAARPDVMQILRGAGRTAGPGAGRLWRNSVVIAEVALSFVLLVGSGLMFRSFIELRRVDPGYDPHGLLTFLLIGDARGFQPQRRLAFLHEIQGRLRAMPGVESVSASNFFPLKEGFFGGGRWGAEQARADPAKFQAADFQTVLPGYFETLRTRLVEGRTFTQDDNAPGRNLAIIDQLLAAKAFPNQSAVGKRIIVPFTDPAWVEVIGVVAHQRLTSLAEPGREQIYLTDGFWGVGISRHWAIRTAGDPAKYAAAIRAEMARFAPGLLAVTEMQTMDAIVDRAQAGTRFHLLLIGVFAVIAALLAGVGLYGVLSTVVRQRTAEIGLRMALGAAPASIFSAMVGQGLRLSAVGIAIGLVAALGLTRVMTSMLVGVRATDPCTFAAMAAVFLLIAAAASWLPARRAAALDPISALRQE